MTSVRVCSFFKRGLSGSSSHLPLQYALLSFHHQPHTPSSFHLGAALPRQEHQQGWKSTPTPSL